MRIKMILNQLIQWGLGIIVGFLIVNVICFAYERQPGWYNTPCGASVAVREPNSVIVYGAEGYAISKTDRNGYTNPDKELADNYVLMMGASHTQGKEIDANKKYSALVNEYVADDELLHVYNIACDGAFLPSQIKHFKAGVSAFSKSDMVTIEIFSTDYSVKELEEALIQPDYNDEESAVYFSKLSTAGKIKNSIKDYLPIVSKIKRNIETIKNARASKTEYQVDANEYKKVINKAMGLLRKAYDKPIVFIYHPGVVIEKDGGLSLKYSSTWDIFREACEENGIGYIDSGDDFVKYYNENKKVPYGFFNTTLGSGHLNETGHRIIAREIIEYMEGIEK